MSDTFYYTKLYACLSGWRLMVLANRLACQTDLARELHDSLLQGLSGAMSNARHMGELERNVRAETDPEELAIARFLYDGLADILDRTRIVLLDDLEIDFETHEYRVNGGEWFCALSADCDGVSVDYPTTVGLPDEELGRLRPIIRGISAETGIEITVERIDYR